MFVQITYMVYKVKLTCRDCYPFNIHCYYTVGHLKLPFLNLVKLHITKPPTKAHFCEFVFLEINFYHMPIWVEGLLHFFFCIIGIEVTNFLKLEPTFTVNSSFHRQSSNELMYYGQMGTLIIMGRQELWCWNVKKKKHHIEVILRYVFSAKQKKSWLFLSIY